MKLVVSHAAPDFDALASLALARVLHPGAVIALQGGLTPQLEAALNLYRDHLQPLSPDELELSEVSELIVVDTGEPERIAPFDRLLGQVPVTLYDHHPRSERAIAAAHGLRRELGATATLLSLLIASRNLPLSPELASLALLGIHDDTGSFSYPSTRAEDHQAAAFLLQQGASLDLVGQYLSERYDETQRRFLREMLGSSEEVMVQGWRVVVAQLESSDYVPGLAPLCSQLLELYSAEAAFIIARMDDKTLLVGRAAGLFDVGRTLSQAFGGGGHPGAGFARSELPPNSARAKLLAALEPQPRSTLTARELMSSPVKTVRESDSTETAQALLSTYGHNGLPVVDAGGRLVGIVTRRNLDKAMRHQVTGAPVKAFMSPRVVTATPETPLHDLEALLEQHAIGRVPIVNAAAPNDLVGIVTRSDVLRAHHPPKREASGPERLLEQLPTAALHALDAASEHLQQGRLYLVGGTVRDALLGVGLQDLDLSLEGWTAPALAQRLQRQFGGELSCHFDFGTCTLRLPSGLLLDLATAREESYQHPGALPTVRPGNLRSDLARRDFSVNALALRLEPGPEELIDPYGGLADLKEKRLRTLHPLSFVHDPTRILRGARLAGRLGFHFEEATHAQIPAALEDGVLAQVSASRLRSELELTLAELQVRPALEVLDETGALAAMFGLRLNEALLGALDAARREGEVPAESYLLALLLELSEAEREAVIRRFHWPRRYLEVLGRLEVIRRSGTLEAAQLPRLGRAERSLLRALDPKLKLQLEALEQRQGEPQIRGQDVIDLGLPSGPAVGEVLSQVAEARRDRVVTSYQEELELARNLVRDKLERQEPS